MTQPIVLWADDDAPVRFIYERMLIEDAGWQVRWAEDLKSACETLAETPVRALLLDQMLPWVAEGKGHSSDKDWSGELPRAILLWSGCLLLRWLRGAKPPGHAPPEVHRTWEKLKAWKPHPDNRDIDVMIVSAFWDEVVTSDIRSAGKRDEDIRIITKPAREDDILAFLQGVGENA